MLRLVMWNLIKVFDDTWKAEKAQNALRTEAKAGKKTAFWMATFWKQTTKKRKQIALEKLGQK